MKPFTHLLSSSLRGAALVAALALSGADLQAQHLGRSPAFPGPTHPRAVPDYGTTEITVSWTDNSRNETGFEVWRSDDGGPFGRVHVTAANVTTWDDATVDTLTEYRYRVRAVNAVGPSAYTRVVRQNLKTFWPVPQSHEILHNWNETIGTAALDETGTATGFHMGVDIRRVGTRNTVRAIRGGVVQQADEDPDPAGDGVVVIRSRHTNVTPAGLLYFQTNHVWRLLVGANDVVYAGQVVAEISEAAFPDAVEHTHYVVTDLAYQAIQLHPLLVFSAPGDLDPGLAPPAMLGPVRFQRQGAAAGDYLPYDDLHPLEGDVDIILEFGDVMGTSPVQVPSRLGYWIEQPPLTCAVTYNDVKDPGSAYFLFSWFDSYFGDAPSPMTVASAIVDTFFDYGATLPDYPWPNYKHFVLTNTKGSNGAHANVDATQYWNTNALDDGEPATTAHANYAGRPDTSRARDARFPDGVYTLHVIANDLIQDAGPFLEIPIRLENFNPIVCETNPFHGEILAPGTDEVHDLTVTFNEPMDTSVDPSTVVSVNNGAALHSVIWISPVTIRYDLVGMQDGTAYTLTVSGATARDLPGTPGGRLLDGNEDGFGGDDHIAVFFVASP